MNVPNFFLYPSVSALGLPALLIQMFIFIAIDTKQYQKLIIKVLISISSLILSPIILNVALLYTILQSKKIHANLLGIMIFNSFLFLIMLLQIVNIFPILCEHQTYSWCTNTLYLDFDYIFARPMIMYRPSGVFISTIWLSLYLIFVYMLYEKYTPSRVNWLIFIFVNSISGSLASLFIMVFISFSKKVNIFLVWLPFLLFNVIFRDSFEYNYNFKNIILSLSRSEIISSNIIISIPIIVFLFNQRIRFICSFIMAIFIHPIFTTLIFILFFIKFFYSTIGYFGVKNGKLYFVKA